jgi:hypothetical protein
VVAPIARSMLISRWRSSTAAAIVPTTPISAISRVISSTAREYANVCRRLPRMCSSIALVFDTNTVLDCAPPSAALRSAVAT